MKEKYKSSSKKTLACSYDVTVETFNKWIQPIDNTVGEYIARAYTPKQVETIVKHLGMPEHSELICG